MTHGESRIAASFSRDQSGARETFLIDFHIRFFSFVFRRFFAAPESPKSLKFTDRKFVENPKNFQKKMIICYHLGSEKKFGHQLDVNFDGDIPIL